MAREESTLRYTVDADNRPYFTPEEAVGIVRAHGIMLEAARGPAPSFASAAAGETVPGNWWGHARRYQIFDATNAVRESERGTKEVLVCRLLGGKVTYVHWDLWPALVRLSDRFDSQRLGWVHNVHTGSGAHRSETEPFPDWVPAAIRAAADAMTEEQAVDQLAAVEAGRALL